MRTTMTSKYSTHQRQADLRKVKTLEDEINFILKHCPELKDHREDLEPSGYLSMVLTEIICRYQDKIDIHKRNRQRLFDREKKRISRAEKAGVKDLQKQDLPKKAQGNQTKQLSKQVADILKDYWINVLGHKKFFYGIKKRHPDNAMGFVDTIISVYFRGNQKILAKHHLKKISDRFDIKS